MKRTIERTCEAEKEWAHPGPICVDFFRISL